MATPCRVRAEVEYDMRLGRNVSVILAEDCASGVLYKGKLQDMVISDGHVKFPEMKTRIQVSLPISDEDASMLNSQKEKSAGFRKVPTSTTAKRIAGFDSATSTLSSTSGISKTYSRHDKNTSAIPTLAVTIPVATTPKKTRIADPSEVEQEDDFEVENSVPTPERKDKDLASRRRLFSNLRSTPQSEPTRLKGLTLKSIVDDEDRSPLTQSERSADGLRPVRSFQNSLSNLQSQRPMHNTTNGTPNSLPSWTQRPRFLVSSWRRPDPMLNIELPVEIPDTKRKGYENVSSVCYANAVVQALVTCQKLGLEITSDFWDEVLNSRNQSSPQTPIFLGLRRCFQAMTTGEVVSANELIRQHLGPGFANPHQQHDAHEFLMSVFGAVHVELAGDEFANRENRGTFLSQLKHRIQLRYPTFDVTDCTASMILPTSRIFEATLEKTITCASCNTAKKSAPETFLVHSLDFVSEGESTEAVDLETLLKMNLVDDTVKELKCESCKDGTTATVHAHFTRLPRVLILHVKRFSRVRGLTGKRQDRVLAPMSLSLKPLLATMMNDMPVPPIIPPPPLDSLALAEYDLIATVAHQGWTAASGHYTTVARDMDHSEEKWFRFNDSIVTSESASWNLSDRYQKDGYIFFYRLKYDK